MNITLLITFIVLSIVNVILQTVKSIVTVKCGKFSASIVNAVAFGLYTVVTVYTMCDLPLMIKALIVALCNLISLKDWNKSVFLNAVILCYLQVYIHHFRKV